MKYYETLYLINPDLSEDVYKEVVDKFRQVVEKNKGVIIKVEEWGRKNLAYAVKRFDKGYYVLIKYCGDRGVTDRVKSAFKVDERVIRFQTVKLSDHADPEELKKEVDEGEKEKPLEPVEEKEPEEEPIQEEVSE